MNIDKYLMEVEEWSKDSFGEPSSEDELEQSADYRVLGMTEEVGELGSALNRGITSEIHDGVGDVVFYSADFLWRADISFDFDDMEFRDVQDFVPMYGRYDVGKEYAQVCESLGQVSRSRLKRYQGIREDESRVGVEAERSAVFSLWFDLAALTESLGMEFEGCVMDAFEEVMNRRWESKESEKYA